MLAISVLGILTVFMTISALHWWLLYLFHYLNGIGGIGLYVYMSQISPLTSSNGFIPGTNADNLSSNSSPFWLHIGKAYRISLFPPVPPSPGFTSLAVWAGAPATSNTDRANLWQVLREYCIYSRFKQYGLSLYIYLVYILPYFQYLIYPQRG